ncbi:hypothetical protein K5X77_08675 [Vagococcus lutrae]|uniref:ECF transporter S component n=1 Tax=Vagococcus lutrae TaxID=81947 RepID=UPI001C93F366|nr:ECF transporter S component [Vagococcus lutrae]MDT2824669.1 hypothetical protein [Vagococcus lutrae]QZN88520.1 hypothetical protein K5X77_08675 [Vagococcus lutrae]
MKNYLKWSIYVWLLVGAYSLSQTYAAYGFYLGVLTTLYIVIKEFEQRFLSLNQLVVISMMIAMGTIGRLIFFFIPGVNPMSAIVILTSLYLGRKEGMIVGLMLPFVSNFFFTQGPWTPFQMLAMLIIGGLAGQPFVANLVKQSFLCLGLLAVFSGVGYSLLMDIWTTLSIDGYFSFYRYFILIGQALPFTIKYSISNIIFLKVLQKPLAERFIYIRDELIEK